jgi:hypothetical protein
MKHTLIIPEKKCKKESRIFIDFFGLVNQMIQM